MKKDNEIMDNYKKLFKEALEELKTPGKRHKQIPNILTVLRLFAPCFIIPAAASGNIPLTIGMAAGFGLTDMADGFIARHWKLTSELGKDLDALADKLFSGTLLLAASFINPLLLMNVGLEMVIAGVNIYQKTKGKETASTLTGKIKTWALFALAGLGIVSTINPSITNAVSLGTAALQALTIHSYIEQYNKKSEPKTKQQQNKPKEKIIIPKTEDTDEKEYSKVISIDSLREQKKELEPEELLEQLKEMSEFLHQEQQNQLDKEHPEAVNNNSSIQMIKTDRRNN